MGVDTNTFLTFSEIGAREDLTNMIWNVSPTDTVVMNNASTTEATNRKHEWQTDTIAAAASNAQLEGQAFSADSISATTRLNNLTTISGHYVQVSGSVIKQIHAGAPDEMIYQTMKATKRLKRDIEYTGLQNGAPTTGNSSTAQLLAALPQWYVTNTVLGSGGANVTYTNSPGSARTDGTQTAITEINLKTALHDVFINSSEFVDVVMTGPVNKINISTFAGPTGMQRMNEASKKVFTPSFDLYESDFGQVKVVPNRFQRERDIHLLNFDYLAFAWFRPLFIDPLPKDGDSERAQLIAEWTLEVRDEAALGLIADNTTTIVS